MCFGGACGANIDLSAINTSDGGRLKRSESHDSSEVENRPDLILFSETPATFLVEVENTKIAKKLFANVPHLILGQTIADENISVNLGSQNLRLSVSRLKSAWQKPMKEIFHERT